MRAISKGEDMLKIFGIIIPGRWKGICGTALTVILTLGGLHINTSEAFAATEKTKNNTTLGTWSIPAPTAPSTGNNPWSGSKVYFGKYNGNPVLYRVLSPDGSKNTYGSKYMLLDCDSILFTYEFRTNTSPEIGYAHDWSRSDIKAKLNGDDFYGSNSVFTAAERNAIVESQGGHKVSLDGLYTSRYLWDYTPADDSHVFLLEDEDVLNTDYGYPRDDGWNNGGSIDHPVASREKSGSNGWWWLRSPESDINAYVCVVYGYDNSNRIGCFIFGPSSNDNGVSPAFNVDLSSVIFSTEVGSSTYKLTIKDDSMGVDAGTATKAGNTVTVPVQVTGGSRLSLLVTDRNYDNKNAEIKEYKTVTVSGDNVSFELPNGYRPDWKVYLMTETLNDDDKTDYASAPCRITLPGEKKDNDDKKEDKKDDGDHEDHTPPSWVLNPNEKQQLSIMFSGILTGFTAGYQEQGPIAQALFTEAMPKGWKKAFSFNILNKDRQPETSLKSGKLTLNIPAEYQRNSVSAGNAGRQFAILAMDKNGKVYVLYDTDTDPATITVNVNFEGYAMNLIYKD